MAVAHSAHAGLEQQPQLRGPQALGAHPDWASNDATSIAFSSLAITYQARPTMPPLLSIEER